MSDKLNMALYIQLIKTELKLIDDLVEKICEIFREGREETEEILDSILPPREWEEEGKLWRQSVSSTPATRYTVRYIDI